MSILEMKIEALVQVQQVESIRLIAPFIERSDFFCQLHQPKDFICSIAPPFTILYCIYDIVDLSLEGSAPYSPQNTEPYLV